MKSVLISLALAALPSHGDGVQVLRDSSNTLLLTSGIKEAGATHGKVEVVNGTLRYTPEPGFSGADKVTTVLAADGSESVLEIEVRTHPNFLFILADDQSWTGLSAKMDKVNPASGSDFHRTPHLDQLAAEGTRFSRGYSPAPNCSPTRYANLTGKTCARLKFTDILGRGHTKKSIGRPLIPINKATFAIKDEETTIPELLKSLANANYTTAHFGKWHLGGGGPEKHGFDVSDGPTGNREGDLGPVVNEDPKRAFQIAKRGNAFMEKATASGQPFYCQLSHYAVHAKIQYRKETLTKTGDWKPGEHHTNPAYAAMVADLDDSVNITLQMLDELGLRHSTYVIYQADNGAPRFMSNAYPLRRFKPEIWEGGIRVPTLFRGPGIPADTQCDEPVMGIDLLPTLWELAGGVADKLPASIDGGSLVATLHDRPDATIKRPGQLVVHSPHYVLSKDEAKNQRPSSAIFDGPWKLVAWYETGEVQLFNLGEDLTETNDVSSSHPSEKLRLWRGLRDYLISIDAQFPALDASHPDNKGKPGDADADGLPDEWEIRNLLSFAQGSTDDPDGDGKNNAAEFAAKSDPLSP